MSETKWAILDNYSYSPVEVIRDTKHTLFFKQWNTAKTDWVERRSQSFLLWRGTEAEARVLSGKLQALRDERYRRVTDAGKWFREEVERLFGDDQ